MIGSLDWCNKFYSGYGVREGKITRGSVETVCFLVLVLNSVSAISRSYVMLRCKEKENV